MTDAITTRNQSGKRTDVFRPGAIDPADFEYLREYPPMVRDFKPSDWWATCAHCGVHFIYGAEFKHKPTGEIILVGHTCANYVDSTGRVEYLIKRHGVRMRNEAEKAANAGAVEAQLDSNPRVADVLFALVYEHDETVPTKALDRRFRSEFLRSAARRAYVDRKPFSDKHLNAVVESVARVDGWIADDAKRKAEEPQPEGPLVEGRVAMTGTIVSHKWQDGLYGDTHKMLVLLDDGNKVWGSVPANVADATVNTWGDDGELIEAPVSELKGARLTFTATVERSKDDEHFGFFKRPSKATVTDPEGVTE